MVTLAQVDDDEGHSSSIKASCNHVVCPASTKYQIHGAFAGLYNVEQSITLYNNSKETSTATVLNIRKSGLVADNLRGSVSVFVTRKDTVCS